LRYRSAADLETDLKRLKRDTSSGRTPRARGDSGSENVASVVASNPGLTARSIAGEPVAPSTSSIQVQPQKSRTALLLSALLLLVILALSAAFSWNKLFRSGLADKAFANAHISSLTLTGDVVIARISPDGRYLAYISRKGGKFSLWVRQISIANPV